MGNGKKGGFRGSPPRFKLRGTFLLRVAFIHISTRLCHEKSGGVSKWWEAAVA